MLKDEYNNETKHAVQGVFWLWRWRESNPRPKDSTLENLRAYPVEGVAAGHSTSKIDLQPAARARRPSFAQIAASCAALHHCDAQSHHRVKYGTGGRGLARRPAVYSLLLTQRGAWRRRKCGWHLIVCAEFTRSAPLGSHSGTSLFRRSLSSPNNGDKCPQEKKIIT